jgi:hypothetical protein
VRRRTAVASAAGRVRHVPCPESQPLEELEEFLALGLGQVGHAEVQVGEGGGRRLDDPSSGVGEGGQDPAPVVRVRTPADVPGRHQPVDRIRDAGGVDHQPAADDLERQLAAAAEAEQDQHLVAGEGQLERLEHLVEAGQQDLLDTEDRRRRPHRRRRAEALLPVRTGTLDRVERQPQRTDHAPTLPPGASPSSRESARRPRAPMPRPIAAFVRMGAAPRRRIPAVVRSAAPMRRVRRPVDRPDEVPVGPCRVPR